MVELHAIDPTDGARLKAVRLRALLDAPSAFGSTHADVSRWSDADWDRRAAQLAGERQVGFIAADASLDIGMVAGSLVDGEPTRAALISMWVAPTHRRRGAGRLLVSAVADWARSRGVTALVLSVTSSNSAAMQFYERLSFVPTGRTESYPNDPALLELELVRHL